VLVHGRNARLVDFFDVDELANTALTQMEKANGLSSLSSRARADALHYSLHRGSAGYERALETNFLDAKVAREKPLVPVAL
jgi:hypothetical protein